MDKERPLWVLPAGLTRLSGSLFSDLSAKSVKILAIVVIANLVLTANNYFLVAVGVISSVGPFKAALVVLVVGVFVKYWVYRPSLRCGWPVWRSVLLQGVTLGVNNVAVLYTFRWIRPQTVAPLSFFCTVMCTICADIIEDRNKDTGKRNYSTLIWPILAVPGIWALVKDSADDGGGAHSSPGPGVSILGYEIAGWILGVAAMLITSATFAFGNKQMEALDQDLKGKISTLAGIPAFAILAVGASCMDGGWKGMTREKWSDLLLCAGAGTVAGLSAVLMVKAYEQGLRASATAMILPFTTLARSSWGGSWRGRFPAPWGGWESSRYYPPSTGRPKFRAKGRPPALTDTQFAAGRGPSPSCCINPMQAASPAAPPGRGSNTPWLLEPAVGDDESPSRHQSPPSSAPARWSAGRTKKTRQWVGTTVQRRSDAAESGPPARLGREAAPCARLWRLGVRGVFEVRQEMSRRDVENPRAAPSPE